MATQGVSSQNPPLPLYRPEANKGASVQDLWRDHSEPTNFHDDIPLLGCADSAVFTGIPLYRAVRRESAPSRLTRPDTGVVTVYAPESAQLKSTYNST
jgi:hypothetical protein